MLRKVTGRKRHILVARLIKRDGGNCCQCDRALEKHPEDSRLRLSIDHIVPKEYAELLGWANAQFNHIDNLRLMCARCNLMHGNRAPEWAKLELRRRGIELPVLRFGGKNTPKKRRT